MNTWNRKHCRWVFDTEQPCIYSFCLFQEVYHLDVCHFSCHDLPSNGTNSGRANKTHFMVLQPAICTENFISATGWCLSDRKWNRTKEMTVNKIHHPFCIVFWFYCLLIALPVRMNYCITFHTFSLSLHFCIYTITCKIIESFFFFLSLSLSPVLK